MDVSALLARNPEGGVGRVSVAVLGRIVDVARAGDLVLTGKGLVPVVLRARLLCLEFCQLEYLQLLGVSGVEARQEIALEAPVSLVRSHPHWDWMVVIWVQARRSYHGQRTEVRSVCGHHRVELIVIVDVLHKAGVLGWVERADVLLRRLLPLPSLRKLFDRRILLRVGRRGI